MTHDLNFNGCPECQSILEAADQQLMAARKAHSENPCNPELKQKLIDAYRNYTVLFEGQVTGDLQTALEPCNLGNQE